MEAIRKFFNKLPPLLREPSTWIGICLIVVAIGSMFFPAHSKQIMSIMFLVAGALGFSLKERDGADGTKELVFDWHRLADWVAKRLREPSSRIAIGLAVSAVGINLSPEFTDQIVTGALLLGGIFGVITPEKGDTDPKSEDK